MLLMCKDKTIWPRTKSDRKRQTDQIVQTDRPWDNQKQKNSPFSEVNFQKENLK